MAKRVELAGQSNNDAPLYRQLEESFIAEIVAGRLKPGDAVPSTYSLAEQFGISRVTAVRCYEELKGRGFLTARRGGSTIVNPRLVLPGENGRVDQFEHESRNRFDICSTELLQRPPAALVPARAWLKTMQAVLEGGLVEFDGTGEQSVIPRLRQAISAFLQRARGLSVYPKNVLLFDSKLQALAFISKHLLAAEDVVAVENPGDPLIIREFAKNSRDVRLMAVDREGAVIEQLEPRSGVKLIVVSPSAQNPTGVIMSERRRQQLARYAGHNGAILLEDDGAAVLRYGKQPEPSLFNKFRDALHLGSFGTYLGPLCQLAYLVVPDHLLERLSDGCDARAFSQPKLEHLALTRMIESGALELAIARQRSTLSKRRQELLSILFAEFKDLLSINAGATGYDLLIRFHSRLPKEQLLQALESCGFESDRHSLEKCYVDSSENQRIEIILPLIETGGPGGNSIERLFAMKRQFMQQIVQDFRPEFATSGEAIPFAPPAAQPVAVDPPLVTLGAPSVTLDAQPAIFETVL
ncbi:MAG: hypothetical protein C0469_16965 [Cyanobacteria bacterium DS2.3.42]|nr:hypothetical protein [Cyanobacteria bacterium DS2.3.42]